MSEQNLHKRANGGVSEIELLEQKLLAKDKQITEKVTEINKVIEELLKANHAISVLKKK